MLVETTDLCQQMQVLQIVYDNFKSTLANDSKKVMYYTGLSSHTCLAVAISLQL